eukprot:FR741260.1.p1 GENE.FR741260.1~~FR741260.1.p1  ORF type:complete len:186 (+),score=23.23 FR741260.1:82-558(+)
MADRVAEKVKKEHRRKLDELIAHIKVLPEGVDISRLQGVWSKGDISGTVLYWNVEQDDAESIISPAADGSSFTITMNGENYSAKLTAGDEELVWSDGDRWTRAGVSRDVSRTSSRDVSPLLVRKAKDQARLKGGTAAADDDADAKTTKKKKKSSKKNR